MNWWDKLRRALQTPASQPSAPASRLNLPGWNLVQSAADSATWRDGDGDVLSISVIKEFVLPSNEYLLPSHLQDDGAVVKICRQIAEAADSGLLEAAVFGGKGGSAVGFIYKRLMGHAFLFTGFFAEAVLNQWNLWCMTAGERGTTGVREATITAQLLQAGKMTMEWYQASWAQDPYDASYSGVDRRNLCYVSDDECYDEQFPQHPLSKVRRVLRELGSHLERKEKPSRVCRSEGEMGLGNPPAPGKQIKEVRIVVGEIAPDTPPSPPKKQ